MLEIIGAIFIIVVGCITHFIYDWTGHNKIVGFFTAVNESTWEHLKLIIAPTFMWLIVEYHFYYNDPNLFFAKFIGLLIMIIIIPLIFYTYMYFIKKDVLFLDISSFIIAAILGQYVFHILLNIDDISQILNHIGMLGLVSIFMIYITHTYVPKKNFIYKDPITKKYGLSGHAK